MSIYRIQFDTEEKRESLLVEHADKYLIEEARLFEGNFLIFTDVSPVEADIKELKQANKLLKAKDKALSERADFIEDVVAEMATKVYQ